MTVNIRNSNSVHGKAIFIDDILTLTYPRVFAIRPTGEFIPKLLPSFLQKGLYLGLVNTRTAGLTRRKSMTSLKLLSSENSQNGILGNLFEWYGLSNLRNTKLFLNSDLIKKKIEKRKETKTSPIKWCSGRSK